MCAATAEDADEPWVACSRAHTMLDIIAKDVDTPSLEIWLSGKGNFRNKIYPEYKANRIGAKRPKWEQEVKKYLTDSCGAQWSDGCEADDMLSIRHHEDPNSILAHLDKDLNQSAGRHYNWELNRLGKVIREAKLYTVSPEEADRFFWYQLLVGDSVDNIKGAPGVGPKTAEKLLSEGSTNAEWYEICQSQFSCEEELDMNAQCVYMLRKNNDTWRNLIDCKT